MYRVPASAGKVERELMQGTRDGAPGLVYAIQNNGCGGEDWLS